MGVVFLKDGHDKPSLTQRTMGEEEDVSAEIEDGIVKAVKEERAFEEEQARIREKQRDPSRDLEDDLDREIAAEREFEERELWREDASQDELGEADDEHSLEQQLVQDFEVQLNAEQTSQDAA